MAKTKRIPWSDEENDRLKELVEEGLDFDEITKILNKEFRDERPVNEDTNKKMKRSRDSVYWRHQELQKKEKGTTTKRRSRKGTKKQDDDIEDLNLDEDGHAIIVKNAVGRTVCMFTTEKGIDEIMSSLKDLF